MILLVLFINFIGCSKEKGNNRVRYLFSFELPCAPSSIAVDESGKIYVGDEESPNIYVFNRDGKLKDKIVLQTGSPISDIKVKFGKIFVVDKNFGVFQFDFNGTPTKRLLYKEDGKTPIFANSIEATKDRLYVADETSSSVLVISMVNIYGKTAKGELYEISLENELITTVPNYFIFKDKSGMKNEIRNISSIAVAPDGRVLVGDSELKKILVYSCNGRYLYDFEKVKDIIPSSIEYDDLIGAEVVDEKTYDPANIELHGRVQVCDSLNSEIHVFTTTGKYLFSYGKGILKKPLDIAIDKTVNQVYVIEQGINEVLVFKY